MKRITRNALIGIIAVLCLLDGTSAFSGGLKGVNKPKVDISTHLETSTKIESAPLYKPYKAPHNPHSGSTQTIQQGKTLGSSSATIAKPSTPVSKPGNVDQGATSRAARREVMRRQDIPTSQQPSSQSINASGRSYEYTVSKPGGGTQTKSVQQQTMDRSHPDQPHWEAGSVKTDPVSGAVRNNRYGQPKLTNDKSKVNYNE